MFAMNNGIYHTDKHWNSVYQYVFGGLVLFFLGFLAKVGKDLGKLMSEHIYERLTYTAEFTSEDESFRWISAWISTNPCFAQAREISIFSSFRCLGPLNRGLDSEPGKYVYLPLDWVALRHRGYWILVLRNKRISTQKNISSKHEILRLQILGGSKSFLLSVLDEAKSAYEAAEVSRTNIYMADSDMEWNKIASRMARSLSSVPMWPADRADGIVQDCSRFLDSEIWYASKGIPWRRGYLLYGPPGTGKTSLVCAIAGDLTASCSPNPPPHACWQAS